MFSLPAWCLKPTDEKRESDRCPESFQWCELSCGCWEWNIYFLQKQQVFLIPESSLQPLDGPVYSAESATVLVHVLTWGKGFNPPTSISWLIKMMAHSLNRKWEWDWTAPLGEFKDFGKYACKQLGQMRCGITQVHAGTFVLYEGPDLQPTLLTKL